jgi:hypothetical protein
MIFTLLVDYYRWHYGVALVQYLRIVRNWWWFVGEFFSVGHLWRALFTPLPYQRAKADDKNTKQSLLISLCSRLCGAGLRLGTILAGLSLMTLGIVVSMFGYIIWLVAPLLPVLFLLLGSALFVSTLVTL